ncbi:unnamed protein product [Lampetra fluviatilis]
MGVLGVAASAPARGGPGGQTCLLLPPRSIRTLLYTRLPALGALVNGGREDHAALGSALGAVGASVRRGGGGYRAHFLRMSARAASVGTTTASAAFG